MLGSVSLFAQQDVSGTVVDESGKALSGVSVKVKGVTVDPTITDVDGKFNISCPSNSNLVFSMIGKITKVVAVNGSNNLNVILFPKDKSIDEVMIYASRTQARLIDLPCKIELISATEIENSKASDLGELLKSHTSVDIIEYPNMLSGIGMRGFAPSTSTKYVSILIDGVPAGTMNMSTITLNGVKQIEILKGPFSSLYGSSAMAGLINIVPVRHTEEITGAVNLSYGSANTLKTSAAVGGKIAEGLSFDFSGFYDQRKGDYKIGNNNILGLDATGKAILDESSYGATMESTSYKAMGANLRVGYNFNDNWTADLYGTYFGTKDIVTNGSFFGVYSPSKKDIRQYTVRMAVSGIVGNHNLKFNPYYNHQHYDYIDFKTDNKKSESTYNTVGFQVQDIITLGAHKLTVGVDNLNIYNKGRSYNDKTGKEKAPYKPDMTNNTYGIFAQGNLHFLYQKLNASFGARMDLIRLSLEANDFFKNEKKSEKYNKFSPNVGLKYNFLDGANIHTNYGMAFLAPDAYQKAGRYTGAYGTTIGNPDLKGESSATLDIGMGYVNANLGVRFDVTYFTTNHKDFILRERVNPNGVPYDGDEYTTFKNANEAKMQGIELMASYDVGSLFDYNFSLKTYFNGTFLLRSEVKNNDKWDDMMYVRKQKINFGVEFTTDNKWNFKINGRFIGRRVEQNWYSYYKQVRPSLPVLTDRTQPEYVKKGLLHQPAFLVFDTHLYYNITNNITVGLNVNNLFDENYTEKDGYNMPGRNFMGNVSFRF